MQKLKLFVLRPLVTNLIQKAACPPHLTDGNLDYVPTLLNTIKATNLVCSEESFKVSVELVPQCSVAHVRGKTNMLVVWPELTIMIYLCGSIVQ